MVARRTAEVSNFLDMLRSASSNDNDSSRALETVHPEWKVCYAEISSSLFLLSTCLSIFVASVDGETLPNALIMFPCNLQKS